MTRPSPLMMPQHRAVAPPANVVTEIHADEHAKNVRPGIVSELIVHDGVVKAKHLTPGMKVRAFLHGEPRGSERTVGTVERVNDGAFVKITWDSGQPDAEYKAAYRFFSQDLYGTTIMVRRRGFVPFD